MSDMERMGAREDRDEREAALKEVAPDYFQDIRDFHTKFTGLGEHRASAPMELPDDLALFRIGFMIEEIAEYAESSGFTHLAKALNDIHDHLKKDNRWLSERFEAKGSRKLEVQFDSLVDLAYVCLGTAFHHGVDFDEGWRRVHEANMKKVLAKSADESKRGYRFDVVKPKNWSPPDLSDLVK